MPLHSHYCWSWSPTVMSSQLRWPWCCSACTGTFVSAVELHWFWHRCSNTGVAAGILKLVLQSVHWHWSPRHCNYVDSRSVRVAEYIYSKPIVEWNYVFILFILETYLVHCTTLANEVSLRKTIFAISQWPSRVTIFSALNLVHSWSWLSLSIYAKWIFN